MKTQNTPTQILLPSLHMASSRADEERIRQAYANDGATSCEVRISLEITYAALLQPTREFNRKLVSYQANKDTQLHSWIKYKEGFSAIFVKTLITKFGVRSGQKILDPFAGSATTLLVAKEFGIDAVGIDVLPICHLAWEGKSHYHEYDLSELRHVLEWVQATAPGCGNTSFKHITITQSAFPPQQEQNLMWYRERFDAMAVSDLTKSLLQLTLVSILEAVSFTRKDGQYLRWDSRSAKVKQRNSQRLSEGKKPFIPFSKGKIADVKETLVTSLTQVIFDVERMRENEELPSRQEMIEGTALKVLPKMKEEQFDTVITSPPYCNRYDYTRTYALELAYLGMGEQEVRDLRQLLLSCTVESRPKIPQLREFYLAIGRLEDFEKITNVINTNAALQEVFAAIRTRGARGELNNKGVVTMIEGYFTELAFVIFECFRVCKNGARVAIVNDNVRYGGEMIPVDLLMTDLAANFGFRPETIYVLPQRKGNSSQQMGRYGREANRKSITVWIKD